MRQHAVGGSRIERRTQDQKLSIVEVRQQIVDALQDDVAFRIEELVDRRSDRDDDGAGSRYAGWRVGEDQPLVAQRVLEQLLGAIFDEGQASGLECGEIVEVEIVDIDRQPLGGERKNQRDCHMARASDHGQIGGAHIRHSGAGGKVDDSQGFSPWVSTNERNGFIKPGANRLRSRALMTQSR